MMYGTISIEQFKEHFDYYKKLIKFPFDEIPMSQNKQLYENSLIAYLASRNQCLVLSEYSYTNFPYHLDNPLNKHYLKEHKICLDVAKFLAKQLGGIYLTYLMPNIKGICLHKDFKKALKKTAPSEYIISENGEYLIHSSSILSLCDINNPSETYQSLIVIKTGERDVLPNVQLTKNERKRLVHHNPANKSLYRYSKLLKEIDHHKIKESALPKPRLNDYLKHLIFEFRAINITAIDFLDEQISNLLDDEHEDEDKDEDDNYMADLYYLCSLLSSDVDGKLKKIPGLQSNFNIIKKHKPIISLQRLSEYMSNRQDNRLKEQPKQLLKNAISSLRAQVLHGQNGRDAIAVSSDSKSHNTFFKHDTTPVCQNPEPPLDRTTRLVNSF